MPHLNPFTPDVAYTFRLFFILGALVTIIACQRDEPPLGPPFNHLPDEQLFTINPIQDMVLFGVEGTRITILAHSLVDQEGELVTDSVQVRLTEAFGLGTLLQNGIKSAEQGQALSLYFYQNSERLQVLDSSPLLVQIPTEIPLDNASLVTGQSSEGAVDWELSRKNRPIL